MSEGVAQVEQPPPDSAEEAKLIPALTCDVITPRRFFNHLPALVALAEVVVRLDFQQLDLPTLAAHVCMQWHQAPAAELTPTLVAAGLFGLLPVAINELIFYGCRFLRYPDPLALVDLLHLYYAVLAVLVGTNSLILFLHQAQQQQVPFVISEGSVSQGMLQLQLVKIDEGFAVGEGALEWSGLFEHLRRPVQQAT